jgi:hypothetical protein
MPSSNMKSITRRIAHLEKLVFRGPENGDRARWAKAWRKFPPLPLQVRFGELRRLPEEFQGERHVETGRRLPDQNGQEWYEFYEVPGPAPRQPPQDPRLPQCLDVVFVGPKSSQLLG